LVRENIPKKIPYQIMILEGHPVETILKHAAHRKPDLTVMGSHGRTGLARMRLGSVAEDILQRTVSPTMVVRAPEGRPTPSKISRILCPVNFTDMSDQNLSASAEIAGAFGAQLVVMHAEEDGRSPSASQKQLCEGLPSDLKGRCNLVEVTRSGNAAEQILLAAREHNVDLITITARHRRLLDFSVIGTTTEKVMRHADGAVLVFPVAV
jgi:nucleotide-binding universal stress UspA family protein